MKRENNKCETKQESVNKEAAGVMIFVAGREARHRFRDCQAVRYRDDQAVNGWLSPLENIPL